MLPVRSRFGVKGQNLTNMAFVYEERDGPPIKSWATGRYGHTIQ